jgi:transposase InsO family protein
MAREEVPVSLRRLIVEVDPSELNVTRFCAEHGISTNRFYEFRRRHAADGDAALEPKSRAPKKVANKTPVEVEDRIVALRKELTDAGLDNGHESIRSWLIEREEPTVPSGATIWRILRDRGFITPDPSKAPKRSRRRFVAARANELWQLDDTDWALADGTEVKILNVLDDHSRHLVASEAMRTCTGAAALAVLTAAAAIVGWPARFLSDNAKAFRETLAAALAALGVASTHSRPYHPQTNGKVERFHQTLKRWLARQPPAATLDELQAQLDWFRHFYNHHRPHRGIDRGRPAHVWTDAPKSGPADRPLGTPTTTHHVTVHGGTVTIGRRYTISVGADHNGQPTLTVITGLACHVFIDGKLIRDLTLDPTRRTQPLHPRPGRPKPLP